MAYKRYQGYQYETSPRKLQPDYEPINKPNYKKKTFIQKNKKTKAKRKIKPKAKMILDIAFIFAVLFAISYQNSLITESFNKKENLKSELNSIEKENEQSKVNIEKSLNLNSVEQSAKEKLGMKKLDNEQKIYVSIPKEDYVESSGEEVVIEENNTSIWKKIINNLKNILN